MRSRFVIWRGLIIVLGFTVACTPIATGTSAMTATPVLTRQLHPTANSTTTSSGRSDSQPQATFNATEQAIIVAKATMAAQMKLTLTAQPTDMPPATLSPAEIATQIQGYREAADITLESQGQTFTYTVTSRFFVFLDDERYPVNSLKCEPEWVMGSVSNGSFRGPDLYPIYFEATRPGSCILTSHDFWVKIVVVD